MNQLDLFSNVLEPEPTPEPDVLLDGGIQCVTLVWNERFGFGLLTGKFTVSGGMKRWVCSSVEEGVEQALAGNAGWIPAALWEYWTKEHGDLGVSE